MPSDYLFDRSQVQNITDEQWEGLRKIFQNKWVGMRVVPEDLAKAGLSRGASLAILNLLYSANVLDLRLVVYHGCRAKPVDHVPWRNGFPTYPWTCPACQQPYRGPVHGVVDGLKYGIVGRLLQKVVV